MLQAYRLVFKAHGRTRQRNRELKSISAFAPSSAARNPSRWAGVSLKLSDTRVYEPQIRARLKTTSQCQDVSTGLKRVRKYEAGSYLR